MSLDSYINQNIQIDGSMQNKSSKSVSQQLSYPSFALSQQNVHLLKSDKYKYSDKTWATWYWQHDIGKALYVTYGYDLYCYIMLDSGCFMNNKKL